MSCLRIGTSLWSEKKFQATLTCKQNLGTTLTKISEEHPPPPPPTSLLYGSLSQELNHYATVDPFHEGLIGTKLTGPCRGLVNVV